MSPGAQHVHQANHVTRKYKFNPCDHVFGALDYHMKRKGYAGTGTFMMMDLRGTLEPNRVVEALRTVMEAHPATACTEAASTWRALPYWRYDGRTVSPKYEHHDLSTHPDWISQTDRLCHERFSSGWPRTEPPPVRFEHYQGPDDKHRLCFRWIHTLMDAQGAHLFLSEMNRAFTGGTANPAILPGGKAFDPLAGYGILKRLRLLVKGARTSAPQGSLQSVSLCENLPERPANSRRMCYILRPWSPARVERMKEMARRYAPPGPALYTRYIAGCVLRAVYLIHAEHGRKFPYYGIMIPMRVPGLDRRPVPGNYLTSPMLRIQPEHIADKRAVAETIHQQLLEFSARHLDLASWSMQWLTSQLRVGPYRKLIDHFVRNQPFATGYAFFGEIDPPLRQFLGTEITNLWGTGVISIPPGWNPTFSKFKDRINFSLAWSESAFPEDVVHRYADLIEQEVFED